MSSHPQLNLSQFFNFKFSIYPNPNHHQLLPSSPPFCFHSLSSHQFHRGEVELPTMSMELCCSTFSFHAKLPSFSRPSITLSNPCHFNLNKTQNSLFGFLGFSSSSRQFSLLQHSSPRTPTPVLASSSSTAKVKKDRLPADLDVQEFPEPNSSIRLSVHVPPAVCDDCYQRVLKEISKEAKVHNKCLVSWDDYSTKLSPVRR